MTKIIIILISLWAYRRIGVLLYKLRHVHSEFQRTSVHYPYTPNLLAYMFDKYIVRSRFHLVYFDFDDGIWRGGMKKITLKVYKEIYFWPWIRLKKHDWEWRLNISQILAARRSAKTKAAKKVP